jgi:ribokinase
LSDLHKRPQIAVVGSLNMDLVARAPRIPQPGETIIGSEFGTIPGGKGANQAVAAARLGAQVTMIGRVGCDLYAHTLLETLSTAGVHHAFTLHDPEASTGVALIMVDGAGQNSIVVVPGANMRLSPADVAAAELAIADADVLILQLESPLEAIAHAAEIAQAHDVTVVLNPAPARALPRGLLARVDVLIPNESETTLLTGLPASEPAEIEMAAGSLLEMGPGSVVLTLGDRGAWLATRERAERIPAFPVMPVDTTAAGDAFVAGFSVALAEGRPSKEAVRWGNAAGAMAATRFGAQSSLPTRGEVEKLLQQKAVGIAAAFASQD